MDRIRIRSAEEADAAIGEDCAVVEIRRDLPFHQARGAAISSFEAAYVTALLARHADDLAAASRSSGLAEDVLASLLATRSSAG